MESSRRPTREGAGVNTQFEKDFVYQKIKLIRKSKSTDVNMTREKKSTVENMNRSHKEKGETSTISSGNVMHNTTLKSIPTKKSSRTSHSEMNRRKLELEAEKKMQEFRRKEKEGRLRLLEMQMEKQEMELAMNKQEMEDEMNLLKMKSAIQEAEFNSEEESEHSEKCSFVDPNFVSNWIETVEPNQDLVEDPAEVYSTLEKKNISEKQQVKSQTDELRILCESISDAIKTVANSNNNKLHEKLIARQTMEKDFPYFDGNPIEWPSFYKQFKNISVACDYNNEEIIMKLQKCLKGEAKSLVAGMMLTENVDLVMKTLELRFGRPEFIIENYIARTRNLPCIKEYSLGKFVQFSAEVNNMISTMKTLKSTGHIMNPQLLKELVLKLPEHLKLEWGKYVLRCNTNQVNLEDFSSWLTECAQAACYVYSPTSYTFDKYTNKPKLERTFSTVDRRSCDYCEISHGKNCSKLESDNVNERWKVVTTNKLCFACLRKNHSKRNCSKKKQCNQDGCKLYHHPLLHNKTFKKRDGESSQSEKSGTVCTVHHSHKKQVLLRTISVDIHGTNGVQRIVALCDEASTVTLLDAKLANDLGLHGVSEQLCLQWTNEEVLLHENSIHLDVPVSKPGRNERKILLRNVRTIENLSLPAQEIDTDIWKKYEHLQNIPLQDIPNEKPLILIGQDNINAILITQVRKPLRDILAPIATKCLLGWSLHGPIDTGSSNSHNYQSHNFHICENKTENELHQLILKSGLKSSILAEKDKRALNIMKNTINRRENRYEIGLLWKDENLKLPESKKNAMRRLWCTEKKCLKNEMFAKEYCEKITSYLDKGYIRKLSQDEVATENSRLWYLPHFAVQNPNKPGKIRLVFDAAAKSNGSSLNDALLTGPDLLQSLVAILMKFRQRKFGFCGDIREMFHQVLIRREDRCAQRFLWRNLEVERQPDEYEMCVMTFGSSCSPVCAQFVKNFTAENFSPDDEIRRTIREKFYVDDYLDCTDSEEEALEKIEKIRNTLSLGGFEIVNWITNSTYTNTRLDDNLLASLKEIGNDSLHRILGLWWDPQHDVFQFTIKNLEKVIKEVPTKRGVLKHLMSVYDPLGLLACFVVRGKILMQDIWRAGIDWDQELPQNLKQKWFLWVDNLKHIMNLKVPRCYSLLIPVAEKIQLHTFCDESEKSFAAVVYLRVETKEQIDVVLIISKTRVSPLKPLSIPRLELQAAVMASRLITEVKEELEIRAENCYLWSDSKYVLSWIRVDGRKFKPFVRFGDYRRPVAKICRLDLEVEATP